MVWKKIKKVLTGGINKPKVEQRGAPVFKKGETPSLGGKVVEQKKNTPEGLFRGAGVKIDRGAVSRGFGSGGQGSRTPPPIISQARGTSEADITPVKEIEKPSNLRTILTGEGLAGTDPITGEPNKIQAGTLPLGMGGALSKAKLATNLINRRGQVGKDVLSLINKIPAYTRNIAARFSTNPKNIQLTTDLLGRISRNPAAIVGIIGTYPFAGFIKEEALQTLSFAVTSADENDDLEGMQLALQEQAEVLNPDTWEQIIGLVPFANVVIQLKNFYDAAKIKLEIDTKKFNKKSEELENPPPTFAEERDIQLDKERDRELQEQQEDADFFEGIADKKRERELEERTEDTEFFEGLREEKETREAGKPLTESAKSNLGFGILSSSGSVLTKKKKKSKGGK
tara:strand:+ start:4600 stop:5793 length:1194 start_codon:yes stop_codon:yes gene_type:complete